MVEIFQNQLTELEATGHKLLYPNELASLTPLEQFGYAQAWTNTLKELGDGNVYPPKLNVLLDLIQKSHAAIIATVDGTFVSGGKIQPWVIPDGSDNPADVFELEDVSLAYGHGLTVVATEVGGLATSRDMWGKHCGGIVTEAIAQHGLGLYASNQVAVVRPMNIRSANIFDKRLNWQHIPEDQMFPTLGFDILGPGWEGSLIFLNPASQGKR